MSNVRRFLPYAWVLLLLNGMLGACSQSTVPPSPTPTEQAKGLFSYDPAVSFDLKERATKEQGGVIIQDINYAAYVPDWKRLPAYLVKPAGKGPFAGVLFFHWLGSPNGNREEFLDEAIQLASQGTVSLLIQGYFPWIQSPTNGSADQQQVITQTIEVRRALDLLLAQPEVDPRRLGFVGHDYGAMYGAILAGVEHRVKAYVLIAGMGTFSDWSLRYWPDTAAQGEEAYRRALAPVDPSRYVSHAAPAALLFQFANSDNFIPKETAWAFYDSASEPKEVKWYDTSHAMDVDEARGDRRAWLTTQLGLGAPK